MNIVPPLRSWRVAGKPNRHESVTEMSVAELRKNRVCNYYISNDLQHGEIAQLVEQRTENPCVVGSIPTLATSFS